MSAISVQYLKENVKNFVDFFLKTIIYGKRINEPKKHTTVPYWIYVKSHWGKTKKH